MRGPKPPLIELSTRQFELLHQLTRRQSASQQLVRRARIVLLAASGANNSHIGAQLDLARGNVRVWRQRWLAASSRLQALEAELDNKQLLEQIELLLADEARPGTPATFSPEQVVQIIALACEKPPDCGRPISHWSARELADEAIERGIVKQISARSVGRFLKTSQCAAA